MTWVRISIVSFRDRGRSGERQPVSLSLIEQAFAFSTDTASTEAGITIGQGASIVADPKAIISLAANGSITILGSITAPGGTTATPTETEYTYGGGNLSVTAGSIAGSAFLVGDGTGIIRVAGSATADASGNGLELAVQNGFITVVAGGDIILGLLAASTTRPCWPTTTLRA